MTTISITGNATSTPELGNRNGKDVANLTIAVNSRIKQNDQWIDGPTTFYRIAVWAKGDRDTMPQNVCASIGKGDQVIVTGELRPREYEKDGQTRMSLDIAAHEIGLGLRFKPATAGGAP